MGRYTGYWIEGNTIHGPKGRSGHCFIEGGFIQGPGITVKCELRAALSSAGHRIIYILGPDSEETPFYVFHYRIYGPDDNVPWLRAR
jgi:hypothetical protein